MLYQAGSGHPGGSLSVTDILWYLAILFDELGTDFETEATRVTNKLKTRFPDKFTEETVYNRDLKTERKVLEDGA
jgi:hypothetical protein